MGGDLVWVLHEAPLSANAVGQPVLGAGALIDVTERKQTEEQLRELAILDDLTGLYNRRGFITLAQQQLKSAHRAKRAAAYDPCRNDWVEELLAWADRAMYEHTRARAYELN